MIEIIRAAGLFQLLRPRSSGGPEVPVDTVLDIAMELARGDGSVAWVWTVMTTHDFLVAHFPAKARAEFWTDTTLSAASFTPAGKVTPANGGVPLSGRWSFCSGVDNADWMLLQAMFGPPGAAHPDVRMLMVPIGDCRIVDDWDVVGLRGTGSNSVIVDNAFVPEHCILKFEDLMAGKTPGSGDHASPAYRTPLWAIFPFSIAAVAPGIARGAFEAFVAEKKATNALATLSPPKKNSLQMKSPRRAPSSTRPSFSSGPLCGRRSPRSWRRNPSAWNYGTQPPRSGVFRIPVKARDRSADGGRG
ncbi:MAG TPA: hypothetical protein VII91_05710 [Bauldia sp.]